MLAININKLPVSSGFGFSIAGGKNDPYIQGDNGFFVTNVFADGVAHREGSLKVEDKILKVGCHNSTNDCIQIEPKEL